MSHSIAPGVRNVLADWMIRQQPEQMTNDKLRSPPAGRRKGLLFCHLSFVILDFAGPLR